MPKPKTEAADYERLTVRLPPKLVRQLKTQARKERRAFNTHVIACFERLMRYDREKNRARDTADTEVAR
jgi:predicted HicB family RNase H-like nuclease